MAEFSATDAALNGFRVVWERPVAVVYWAALQLVTSLGLTAFLAESAGPAFNRLASVQPGADPSAVLDLFRQILPTYVVLIAATLVIYSVLYAAMNRVVMRPDDDAFGYLRLSSDELRQLGLLSVLFAMAFVLYVMVLVVGATGLSLVLAATGAGRAGAPLALFILLPIVACLFVFLGVRFSLASPLTFATQRIDIFGSWGLTRGRFWALFGAYLLAFALYVLVLLLTSAIAIVGMAVFTRGGLVAAMANVFQPDLSSLATVMTPARFAYAIITSIGAALALPVIGTPAPVIYRALAGGPASTSRVFE